MIIESLKNFFTASTDSKSSSRQRFWLSLSIAFSLIYSILALQQAFGSDYVASSDAMVYVFWLRKFLAPQLLSPHDVIANYWQSVTPKGYVFFIKLFTLFGVDPLLITKLLPLALSLITTVYGFGICMEIFPVPAAGFFATLMMNQALWMGVSLATGTPLSFIYPLFLAFLYYLLQRKIILCLVILGLQGLFYPQYIFISVGILFLRLLRWEGARFSLSQDRKDYWLCLTGIGVALLVIFPYAWKSFQLGAAITGTQARTLPEFSAQGRHPFFPEGTPTLKYWFCGLHSGILPHDWCILRSKPSKPPQIFLIFLLPIFLLFPSQFPLSRQIKSKVNIIYQTIIASLAMFFVAHVLAPKLYFPGRYTQHSLRLVIPLAAGIAMVILLDTILDWAQKAEQKKLTSLCLLLFNYTLLFSFYVPSRFFKKAILLTFIILFSLAIIASTKKILQTKKIVIDYSASKRVVALTSTLLLIVLLMMYPSILKVNNFPFPTTDYITGDSPELYDFFAQQPKDILIASLSDEANNLSTFAQRSILVGWRFQSPFKRDYHFQFRQRAIDLIDAQYSSNIEAIKQFSQKYKIDFLLVDQTAFLPDYFTGNSMNKRWLKQFKPATSQAVAKLEAGKIPALVSLMEECSVFENQELVVLDTSCLLKQGSK